MSKRTKWSQRLHETNSSLPRQLPRSYGQNATTSLFPKTRIGAPWTDTKGRWSYARRRPLMNSCLFPTGKTKHWPVVLRVCSIRYGPRQNKRQTGRYMAGCRIVGTIARRRADDCHGRPSRSFFCDLRVRWSDPLWLLRQSVGEVVNVGAL